MRALNLEPTRTLAVIFWSPIDRGRWVGGGVEPATTARRTHRAMTEATVRDLRREGVAAFAAPIADALPEGPPAAWHFNVEGRTE